MTLPDPRPRQAVADTTAPLAIACPTCKVGRGRYCRTDRHPTATQLHAARRHAVAGWTADERRDAVHTLAEEQRAAAQTRADEVDAHYRQTTPQPARLRTLDEVRAARTTLGAAA